MANRVSGSGSSGPDSPYVARKDMEYAMDLLDPAKERVLAECDLEDRSSWTNTIKRKMKKGKSKLSKAFTSEDDSDHSSRKSDPQEGRDSGIFVEGIEAEAEKARRAEEELTAVMYAMEQRKMVAAELIDTEERYLADLTEICRYKQLIQETKTDPCYPVQMPQDLKVGKDKFVFGNIVAIKEFHERSFTSQMRQVVNDPAKFRDLFERRGNQMKLLYGKFCINKPKSELIVNMHRDGFFRVAETHFHLPLLADELIKPIQMLTRYHLFLSDLGRWSDKAGRKDEGDLYRAAHNVAMNINNNANDMMDVGRVEKFEGDITAQGVLLHRGTVHCKINKSKKRVSAVVKLFRAESNPEFLAHMFLFQQSVIVCELQPRTSEYGRDVLVYWHHFLINKMQVRDVAKGGDEHEFELHDQNTNSTHQDLNLLVSTDSAKDKDTWVNEINKLIKKLRDITMELINPTGGSFDEGP